MIEKELKVLLSEGKFKELLKYFKLENGFVQINIYYDDKLGVIEHNKMDVRVRVSDGTIKLQVKLPGEEDGNLHIREEYEKELNIIPFQIKSEELLSLVKKELPDVFMLGTLITERYIINIEDGVVACLDKNIYMNKIDYELEVEYVGELRKESLAPFFDHGILFDGFSIGKKNRFMKEYNKSNSQ